MESSGQPMPYTPDPAIAPNVDLTPDPITALLLNRPADVVAFEGYLGQANSPDYVRVYQDTRFLLWVTVKAADVVARYSTGGTGGSLGTSVILVRRDAYIVRCESVRASVYEAPSGGGDPTTLEWPRR